MSTSLEKALTPFKRRLQWRSSLKTFWISLIIGLALTCLLLGLGRIWPLLFQWQLLVIGLLSLGVITILGQFYAWFRPRPLDQLTQQGDITLGLQERLSTALELNAGLLKTTPDLEAAQIDDTLKRLKQVPISLKVPLFEPKSMAKMIGLAMVLLLGMELLYLLPNPQEAVVQAQVELDNLIETEIAELEEIQADLLEATADLSEAQVEELTESLQDLIDNLEQARDAGSPEQALAALSEAEETLDAYNEAKLAQEQAFNSLADSLADSNLEAAQEAAQALEQGAFDEAAEALQQTGESPTSQAEADALAESLSQAAAQLAETNPDLAQSLQQAAEALRSGDQQAIQDALEQAAQQLAEAGDPSAGQQQLAEALQNIQEARNQLAQQQSGEGEGQGQGQQAGQGQGQGQGAGQGQFPGDGVGGSGRGDPDGNVAEGVNADEGQPGPMSTDNGANQNRLEDYDSVYVPQHVGGDGGPLVVPDEQGSDGTGIDIGETPLNPNRETGEATVPYSDVFGQYRDQASTALDNEKIPLGMRDYIRQYFGALEPGQ